MRNSLFISVLILLMVVGCRDRKSGDKPVLRFEEINTDVVPINTLLRFSLTFDSKLTADSVFIQKIVDDCIDSDFSASFKVPDYPIFSGKGNMSITFVNGFLDTYVDMKSPRCGEDDTAIFKFVLKDIEGNVSDTILSPQIVIMK